MCPARARAPAGFEEQSLLESPAGAHPSPGSAGRGYLVSPAMRLMVVAMMTTPKT
jgi:hypothetical protein